MLYFWFFDGVLALVCFYCAGILWQRFEQPVRLFFVCGFLLLGLAATAGSIRYGFNWQNALQPIHNQLTMLYSFCGQLWVALGLLSLVHLIKFNRQQALFWLLIVVTLFVLLHWILPATFGLRLPLALICGISLLVCGLITAWRLFYQNKRFESFILLVATLLYLINGLAITGSSELLFGLDIRAAVFHSLLAVWCLLISKLVIRLRGNSC